VELIIHLILALQRDPDTVGRRSGDAWPVA
jgi:hypothetical protein